MSTLQTCRYTRADYMRLPEGFPAELIDGMLVKEPSPTRWHQELVLRLVRSIERQIGVGRVVISPIDVFVDDHNVLQPDVAVLPEGTPVDLVHIPIPELVAEVLSPSTAGRDRTMKTDIYLRAGVKEVWLVDPETETVEIVMASGRASVGPNAVAHAKSLPFDIDLAELFRVA